MKKLLYTLAGLIALALFASCNKEAERPASSEGEVVTATFTVAAPEGVATKAISDGTTATNLIVVVYDEQGKYLKELSESATKNRVDLTWNVSMKVIKDMTYQFVFLAKSASDNGFSTFTPSTGKLVIDYSKLSANNDNADFFFVKDQITVENSFSKTEEMHRPLAQVNFGASDLAAAAYSINTDNMKTGVTLTGIYSEMSVLTGEVTGAADVTFTQADRVPTEDPKFVDGYDRVAMVYALVAKENQQANVTATLNVTAKSANAANTQEYPITRAVANVPLKRNYRTNILGNIFTNDFNFTVNTVPGFYTPDSNKLIGPSFASVADLNAYFATFTDNADNGDVNPEVVTLTAFGASGTSAATITLPKYNATPVRIRITATYSGTLTLAYADADADKPATVELYAPNMSGATLTGTITSTHLTILEGSHIGTSTVSTSDTTLEIRPTATVGTVKIVKGNANIQGNVANVEVLSSATAVAGTPVQVFVAKEAAIKKIELNAKSDVVVEQPKDHIDVVATEKKIAVYVMEGADNSTAKAQNGGVIYVKAEVPCTVTADGTSTAEDGSAVSSTVIIESTAAGSSVNATNGGSIDLTANANCSASADGVAEGQGSDPDTPSTITVTEVKDETIVIDANTSDSGEIDTTPETSGAVKYFVAQIVGGAKYESLYDAVAAAESGATVEMINNSTETKGFTLTKSLTIDLCEFTVTYDSSSGSVDTSNFPNSRAIKIGGSDKIAVTIENGTIVVGNNVYGPFRIENEHADVVLDKLTLNNSMAYGLGTKIVNARSVAISNTIVNSVVGGGIEKGCDCPTTLTNVTVNQIEEDTQHPWISTALSTEYGGPLTVVSGSYSGKVAAYLFSSGGTMNINGGSFTGTEAAIRVQNNTQESGWAGASIINITAGTFVGPLILDAWGAASPVPCSEMNISGGTFTTTSGQGALFQVNGNYSHLTITGGTFSEDPSAYVAPGYEAVDNGDNTWTVSRASKVDYATFNAMLYAAGGEWTVPIEVVLKESQKDYFNNSIAQFYLNRTLANNINGTEGDITVKNVTFTYSADDDNTELTAGELQSPLSGSLTMEDCTFIGVSVSPWSTLEGSQQNYPTAAVFKNCTFKDLSGRYAIHQNLAKNLTVEGCAFTNCERGIHTNCPKVETITIKNNTFTGIGNEYGMLCLAEHNHAGLNGNVANATISVVDNDVTGQACLRFQNQSGGQATYEQVKAIFDNNTYGNKYATKSEKMYNDNGELVDYPKP